MLGFPLGRGSSRKSAKGPTLMTDWVQLNLPLFSANDRRPLVHGLEEARRGGSHDSAICIYCGAPASTRDHVPPRCLLEKPLPPDLMTVPSCQSCNTAYSHDEQYLQIVLAQIGFEPHLMAKVEKGGVVDRALSRAPALDERIVQSLDVAPDGRVWFKPERERILTIARKIAFGLYIRRYQRRVSLDQFAALAVYGNGDEIPQPIVASSHYWPGVRRKSWQTVQRRVFSYLFAKGWLACDPQLYCLIDLHHTLLAAVACPDPRTIPRTMNSVFPGKPSRSGKAADRH